MTKYLNVFETQELENKKNKINPDQIVKVYGNNVEVNYKYRYYYLTPKQIMEYSVQFLNSFHNKYFTHKWIDEQNFDKELFAQKISESLHNIFNETGLQLRNLQFNADTLNVAYYKTKNENDSLSFNLDISFAPTGPQIQIDNELANKYILIQPNLVKIDQEDVLITTIHDVANNNTIFNANGFDTFYIGQYEIVETNLEEEQLDDEFIEYLESFILNPNDFCILCEHNTYSNFIIAYHVNDSWYTYDPNDSEMYPHVVNDTFELLYNEWISFGLPNNQNNTEINTAISTLRSDFKNWYNKDFSSLSVLDDIKVKISDEAYNVLIRPWKYLDEEYLFNDEPLEEP